MGEIRPHGQAESAAAGPRGPSVGKSMETFKDNGAELFRNSGPVVVHHELDPTGLPRGCGQTGPNGDVDSRLGMSLGVLHEITNDTHQGVGVAAHQGIFSVDMAGDSVDGRPLAHFASHDVSEVDRFSIDEFVVIVASK